LTGLSEKLTQLQDATAKDLGTVKQYMERESASEQLEHLAGLERKVAEFERSANAQLAGLKQLAEQMRPGEPEEAAQLDQLVSLDQRLTQISQVVANELAGVSRLVDERSVQARSDVEQQFSNMWKSSSTELAAVRQLVEQQTTLLEAFVQAAERLFPGGKIGRSDPVVDSARSQFEQLQKKSPERSR
jgi:hypothetical protein